MNRRDIIIIAVLINAGLLVVLFTSALKSDSQAPVLAATTSEITTPKALPAPVPRESRVRGDEVDQVLSQFVAAQVTSSESQAFTAPIMQPIITPAPEASFVEEAQGFATVPQLAAPSVSGEPNSSSSSFKEVKVKKGDVLEKIAKVNHTTVQELMRCNKLSSTQLKIGQVLKVPVKATVLAPTISKSTTQEKPIYVVKNGDNPWTIAVKNQMKLEELLRLNGLDDEKARKLKPGDELRIR